jgi:hypothetical protein
MRAAAFASAGSTRIARRSWRSETLGGLPLAHEQATAYCEWLAISLAEYGRRFAAAPALLLDIEQYVIDLNGSAAIRRCNWPSNNDDVMAAQILRRDQVAGRCRRVMSSQMSKAISVWSARLKCDLVAAALTQAEIAKLARRLTPFLCNPVSDKLQRLSVGGGRGESCRRD